MQRPNAPSACATITFAEALRREMEYRKWVERTHPHLLVGICGAPEMQRDFSAGSVPDAIKRKLAAETSVPPQQSSFSCVTGQKQPQNWYPTKKKGESSTSSVADSAVSQTKRGAILLVQNLQGRLCHRVQFQRSRWRQKAQGQKARDSR